MSRAREVAWWVALAGLMWWAPAIALVLASLLLDRAQARATLVLVDLLQAAGLDGAARAVCLKALRRCDRRRRVLAGRQ